MIFIRPWYLILLLVPFILWLFKKNLEPNNPLIHFVDKRLMPFVTIRFGTRQTRQKLWGFIGLWTLLVCAGSGPAFYKTNVPAIVSAPSSVIIMDLSPAMSGDTLMQAKLKVYDLLTALQGHQAALVLYDKKGYTAVPLTQDLDVIKNMVPALDPSILPVQDNYPTAGFEKAVELFKNARVPTGQIIFLTTGDFDVSSLKAFTEKLPYQISIIGFSDDSSWTNKPSDKSHIDSSNPMAPVGKPNLTVLSSVGFYTPAMPDDTDVRAILSKAPDKGSLGNNPSQKTAETWQDFGPYLLLIASVFFVLLFRKGVLFLIIMGMSFSVHAGLFERPDQTQYRKMLGAVEAYQDGNYEAARQIFETSTSAKMIYNRGNALAYLNDISGAINAYNQALKLQPDLEQARFNKEYLEKQMPPQQNSNQDTVNQNQPPSLSDQQTSNSKEKNSAQDQNQASRAENRADGKQNQDQNLPSSDQDETDQQSALKEEPQPNISSFKATQGVSQAGQQKHTQAELDQSDNQQKTGAITQDFSSAHGQRKQSDKGQYPVQNSDKTHEKIVQPIDGQIPEGHDSSSQQMYQLPQVIEKAKGNADTHQETDHVTRLESQDSRVPLDQESQQLLNKLQQDPSRLLKFRLYQQYKRTE